MFQINEVLKQEDQTYRILAVLPNEIIWIQLNDDSAFPSIIEKSECIIAVENETLVHVEDPYLHISFLTPEQGSSMQIKRDENYELIKPLVLNPLFYIPKKRSEIISQIIQNQGSTKQTLYRLARRYWQRGQTPNSLIPDYINSGAKGSIRSTSGKKIGRPRQYASGVGTTVNEHTSKLFSIVINKYLLTEKKLSFLYVHRKFQEMYKTFYPETPESEIPTTWQLKHFYNREYGQIERIQKRYSKIEYNKDIKPLRSTANTQALGPGSRFEIDATIADIYLVSDSDRHNIVGRPIIYFVIDVFSRMVAGIYIGFENPSYVAAMQALGIAMTDKVEYCKQFGIEIRHEDWPITGLPDAILADRGELLGHQIEALERNFSVRIENTPPYRGDAKGIVERCFNTFQAEFKPFAPGVVQGVKEKKRGGNDYRLDAKLTIHDFTEIILSSVIYRNCFHVLTKYDRDIDMPLDLPMTPLSLWNWGLQHRSGLLRSAPVDALKMSLLPRTKATLSDLGICIFGIYYSSPEIIKQGWLHRAKETKRPDSFEVAYDPRSADNIYLFPNKNSMEHWVCKLTEKSREFIGCSFWDVWQIQAEQKLTISKNKMLADPNRRELEALIEKKIKAAVSLAPDFNEDSNAKRIAAIRKNRQLSREQERDKPFLSPQKQQTSKLAEIIPMPKSPEDYKFPDFVDELFDGDDS